VGKDLSRKSDHLGTRVLMRSEPERRGRLGKSKSASMARTNNSFLPQSCNVKNRTSHEEDGRSTKSATLDDVNGGSFDGEECRRKSIGGIPRNSGSFRLRLRKSVQSLNPSINGGSGHNAMDSNSNLNDNVSSHEDTRSTKLTTLDCITARSFHGEDCRRKSLGGTRGSGSFRLRLPKSVQSLNPSMGGGSGHNASEEDNANINDKNGSSHEDGRTTLLDCIASGSSIHGEDCKRKSLGGTRGSGSFRSSFSKSMRSFTQSMGGASAHDALEDDDNSIQSFDGEESFCQSPPKGVSAATKKDIVSLKETKKDNKQIEKPKGANQEHGVEVDRFVSFISGGSHQPPIAQFSCRELDFVLCQSARVEQVSGL
jgi:hypothetical protein